MIYQESTKACKYCDDIYSGCAECNYDGTRCLKCSKGYFLNPSARYYSSVCQTCSYWGAACKACNLSGCLQCKTGFNEIMGFCFRQFWQ